MNSNRKREMISPTKRMDRAIEEYRDAQQLSKAPLVKQASLESDGSDFSFNQTGWEFDLSQGQTELRSILEEEGQKTPTDHLNVHCWRESIIATHQYFLKITPKQLIAKVNENVTPCEHKNVLLQQLAFVHVNKVLQSKCVLNLSKLLMLIDGSPQYQSIFTEPEFVLPLYMNVFAIAPSVLEGLGDKSQLIHKYFHVSEIIGEMVDDYRFSGAVTLLTKLIPAYTFGSVPKWSNQELIILFRLLIRLLLDQQVFKSSELTNAISLNLMGLISNIPEGNVNSFFGSLIVLGPDGLGASEWSHLFSHILLNPNPSKLQMRYDEFVLEIVCQILSVEIDVKGVVTRYEYCLRELVEMVSASRPTHAYYYSLLINASTPSYFRLNDCFDVKLSKVVECLMRVQDKVKGKKAEKTDCMQLSTFLVTALKSLQLLIPKPDEHAFSTPLSSQSDGSFMSQDIE